MPTAQARTLTTPGKIVLWVLVLALFVPALWYISAYGTTLTALHLLAISFCLATANVASALRDLAKAIRERPF